MQACCSTGIMCVRRSLNDSYIERRWNLKTNIEFGVLISWLLMPTCRCCYTRLVTLKRQGTLQRVCCAAHSGMTRYLSSDTLYQQQPELYTRPRQAKAAQHNVHVNSAMQDDIIA